MEPDNDLPWYAFLKATKREEAACRFPKRCQMVVRSEHFRAIGLQPTDKTIVKGKESIQKSLLPGNMITLGECSLGLDSQHIYGGAAGTD